MQAPPLLLRPRLALAPAVASCLLGIALAVGSFGLFEPAIAAWALCIVCCLRALLARRGRVAALYAAGAAPTTLVIALLVLLPFLATR